MAHNELYHGNNESFKYFVDCYIEYGEEVLAARALSDLRDGLKVVQRRILYKAMLNKSKNFVKSPALVSEALKIHPHGEGSVYGAMTLMTDKNGSFNMPLLNGSGNMGHVWSSDPPAAMRYTLYKLHDNAEVYFKDKDVLETVPSEDGVEDEAVVFPVTFPVVLVNGSEGIAVSAAAKLPSYNFHDVIDLTVKYLKTGEIDYYNDRIIPDFPTGGILVCDDTEITKIMATGRGKLKIRANVEVVGKTILVKEIPFGKTVESIKKAINNSDIKEISRMLEYTGLNSDCLIKIECKSKKAVDYVLMELYRRNILQSVFSSNMLLTEGREPFILGVVDVVKHWVDWRIKVLQKKFDLQISSIAEELITLDYFIRLISNIEWRDTYVGYATKTGKAQADKYLREIFPDIPDEVCTWINGRAISAFNNGGRYSNRYNELLSTKEFYENAKKNTKQYMINEMLELQASYRSQFERKTQITYTDYKFSKISDSDVIEDTSWCTYTLTKDNFLIKSRDYMSGDNVLCTFEGKANSVMIGFDCYGRVIRVLGSEIPFTPYGDHGTYLPKYIDGVSVDDLQYKVLYLSLLDGSKKMLVYRDGFVGFFDTSEYFGKKNIKVINNGVCTAVIEKLLEVVEEDDIPEYMLVGDNSQGYVKVGICKVDTIKEKSRRSRTRVFTGTDIDIHFLKGFKDPLEVWKFIDSPEIYMGKLRRQKTEFLGDPEEVLEGRYVDICVDLEGSNLSDAEGGNDEEIESEE